MSEAFNIKMVRECYYMMQLMEQQDFTFTQDDKRLLLGYAFHQRDLDCVHDAVIHIAADVYKRQGFYLCAWRRCVGFIETCGYKDRTSYFSAG